MDIFRGDGVENDDPRFGRDRVLGKLYDSLLRAQNLAEMAGLNQMAKGLREMRRRTEATLVIRHQDVGDTEVPD